MELDVQVARSDWYEQAVEKPAIGSYLITPVYLLTARRLAGHARAHEQRA
jgi:hypothetical protein